MNDEIIDFIEEFKYKYKEEIEDVFSNGYCYFFAIMLKERFGGEIVYDPIQNHFALCRNLKKYDIIGYTNGHFENWESYQEKELLDTERIYKNCIYKEK